MLIIASYNMLIIASNSTLIIASYNMLIIASNSMLIITGYSILIIASYSILMITCFHNIAYIKRFNIHLRLFYLHTTNIVIKEKTI